MSEPKILALVPTRGIIFTEHQTALETEMLTNGQMPRVLRTVDVPIPDCRNSLIEGALTVPQTTHFLLLDDDVVLPAGGLKAMIDLDVDIAVIDYPYHFLDNGKQVGVATYEKHGEDGKPLEDSPLSYAGLGCVLVKKKVFEKMRSPWFVSSGYKGIRGSDGVLRFEKESRGNEGEGQKSSGEDTFFFLHARAQGFTIGVVKDMVAKHLRINRLVARFQEGRYSMSHEIKGHDRIDVRMSI